MAVRDALLVLLTSGPAYGFQLHGGLAERTGRRRDVNVGQTYSTLDRLTARGLVEPAGETDDGLPLHRITGSGRRAATEWLEGRDAAGADPLHETVDRVLIALSMPGVDASSVIASERERWGRRRAAASARPTPDETSEGDARGRLAALAVSAELASAESILRWLDEVSQADAAALAFPPSADRPRRGRRPARRSPAAPPGRAGSTQSMDA
ncbi:PadR family transcriptional regulator [Agromyces arachidis]|uniref:PadR family transcriptional regulator n=1 Tax=Agromyces arachidis TaxID=766966 RepID=UPI004055E571